MVSIGPALRCTRRANTYLHVQVCCRPCGCRCNRGYRLNFISMGIGEGLGWDSCGGRSRGQRRFIHFKHTIHKATVRVAPTINIHQGDRMGGPYSPKCITCTLRLKLSSSEIKVSVRSMPLIFCNSSCSTTFSWAISLQQISANML